MPSGLPDPHVELCPLCYTVLHDKLWAKMGECSHSYHLKCLLSAFISENAHNSEYVICPACRLAVVSGSPASERRLRKKLNISDPPPELQHIHAPKWKLKSHQLVPGQAYHRTKPSPPSGPGMLSRARVPGTSARQRLFRQVVGTHNIFDEGDGSSAKLPPGPITLHPRMPISVSELLGRPRSAPRRIGRAHADPHTRALTHSRSHLPPGLRLPFALQARQGPGTESPWALPGPADGEPGWPDLRAPPAPFRPPSSTGASAGPGTVLAPSTTGPRPRHLFKIHRPIKRRNYLARHAAIARRHRAAAHRHAQLDP